jgi:hypothetical protein
MAFLDVGQEGSVAFSADLSIPRRRGKLSKSHKTSDSNRALAGTELLLVRRNIRLAKRFTGSLAVRPHFASPVRPGDSEKPRQEQSTAMSGLQSFVQLQPSSLRQTADRQRRNHQRHTFVARQFNSSCISSQQLILSVT